MKKQRKDAYQEVTDAIIAELEKGVRPWFKPWNAGNTAGRIVTPRRHNGQPYRGINILTLWLIACSKGYQSPIWMTYKQAQELAGQVKKGEKAATVFYASKITVTEENERGEEEEKQIPFMKSYYVFNVEQIEGLPEHYYTRPEPPPARDDMARIPEADSFIDGTGADIRHGGGEAFYSPSADYIRLPPFEAFKNADSYYTTASHELTHWTNHASRLNRSFGRKVWGDEGYAKEELVAELGAAFLAAELGIMPQIEEQHAPYIGNWLKTFRGDKRAIFHAAAHAQRAVDYLTGLQPADSQDTEEEETPAAGVEFPAPLPAEAIQASLF